MNEVYIKKDDLDKWIIRNLPQNREFYSIEDLIGAIEEMDSTIESLKEELEDLEQDIQDNYRPISKEEQYEVSYRDFI